MDFNNFLKGANLRGDRQQNWEPTVQRLNGLIGKATWFSKDKKDEILWIDNPSGYFSFKNSNEELENPLISNRDPLWNKVWIKNLTPKINYFWWAASHGKILTIDNLVRRGFHLVNRCVLCKVEEETIMHLFFHYLFLREI